MLFTTHRISIGLELLTQFLFLDLLLGLLGLLRVNLRISCTRTRVWLLVWACDLRDVVDNVYVVIDRLVRHCFVALVA